MVKETRRRFDVFCGLRLLIRLTDRLVGVVLLYSFLLLFLYGIYAVWDSYQIYGDAGADRYESYKPTAENQESFESLMQINPEIVGWITVYGTKIDYPLTQAENNSKYVNTNAKGEYSLSGSLFLDCRNAADFSDFNTIIYGHHMEKGAMFGDLERFETELFFENHKYGSLYLGEQRKGLEIFAVLKVDAYDEWIYEPGIKEQDDRRKLLEYLRQIAVCYRELPLAEDDRIVFLSTCMSEETNGRIVVAAKLTEDIRKGETGLK